MTIGSVSYQAVPYTEYAISESGAYSRHVPYMPTPERSEGVIVDTARAIDILLGQLEQLSYHLSLARTEPQSDPYVAAANADAEINLDADTEARFNALVEQYAQLRDYAEAEGVAESPFAAAGPFAGTLFGVNS